MNFSLHTPRYRNIPFENESSTGKYPLLMYAACFWSKHAYYAAENKSKS